MLVVSFETCLRDLLLELKEPIAQTRHATIPANNSLFDNLDLEASFSGHIFLDIRRPVYLRSEPWSTCFPAKFWNIHTLIKFFRFHSSLGLKMNWLSSPLSEQLVVVLVEIKCRSYTHLQMGWWNDFVNRRCRSIYWNLGFRRQSYHIFCWDNS